MDLKTVLLALQKVKGALTLDNHGNAMIIDYSGQQVVILSVDEVDKWVHEVIAVSRPLPELIMQAAAVDGRL